jgi:hypothetical protein
VPRRMDPRNKRTRPPKGEGEYPVPFQVYVSEDMKAFVTAYAKERGITASEWTRRALTAYKAKDDSRKRGKK